MKSCFFCGHECLAKERHRRRNVTVYIESLESRSPISLLTAERLLSIYSMMDLNNIDYIKEPQE